MRILQGGAPFRAQVLRIREPLRSLPIGLFGIRTGPGWESSYYETTVRFGVTNGMNIGRILRSEGGGSQQETEYEDSSPATEGFVSIK